MNKYLSIVVLLLLAACTCNKNQAVAMKIMKAEDRHLSCDKLKYEMDKVRYINEVNKANLQRSEVYPEMPSCIVPTRLQLDKAIYAADARLNYLNTFYEKKSCEQPIVEVKLQPEAAHIKSQPAIQRDASQKVKHKHAPKNIVPKKI